MSGQNTSTGVSSQQSGNAPSTGAVTRTPSRASQSQYEIPMLEDTEGYMHWHYCMTMVLEENDLMSVTDGTLAKPNATTDADGYADWISRDLKARIQIATTLRNGPLNLILQAKSAKECWDKLATRYQGRGGRRIAYLMRSFFRSSLTDGEPMEPQIDKLVEVNRNLEAISCGVNDETLAYIIIMALPESLSTLKTILFNKDDATVTSEVIIAQILADEERRVHASGGTATAYFAKARKKGSNGKIREKDKDKKKCSHCKKKGHEASECRKKKKDEEEKNNTSNAPKATGSTGSSGSSTIRANVASLPQSTAHR